jgi:hypothetical protein
VKISETGGEEFWILPVNASFHAGVKITETGRNKKKPTMTGEFPSMGLPG